VIDLTHEWFGVCLSVSKSPFRRLKKFMSVSSRSKQKKAEVPKKPANNPDSFGDFLDWSKEGGE
jgi:hypothetical protein